MVSHQFVFAQRYDFSGGEIPPLIYDNKILAASFHENGFVEHVEVVWVLGFLVVVVEELDVFDVCVIEEGILPVLRG